MVATEARYLELAGAARELVADGTLRLTSGNVPLESLQVGRPLPSDGSDTLQHEFTCVRCGRQYVLWVDTYHGGGAWEQNTEA